jgi:hypothetical protein
MVVAAVMVYVTPLAGVVLTGAGTTAENETAAAAWTPAATAGMGDTTSRPPATAAKRTLHRCRLARTVMTASGNAPVPP